MQTRLVFGVVVALLPAIAGAESWPTWRGPNANAVAPAGKYPTELNDQTKAWEVELPGVGSSTPVVWGDAIYLTASQDDQELVCSYTLDGKQRWQVALPGAAQAKHRNATPSNPSAVCDGEHVVAYFKSGDVICLTTDGRELWRKNLQEAYGDDSLWWDLGTSPVITSAGAVIAVMQNEIGYLVTLDLETGQELWRVDRTYPRPSESDQAYTTPTVIQDGGAEVIVTWGADHLTGHDAASGALLWECGGFNPEDKGQWRVIASATIADGVAYVPHGRGDFLGAVRVVGPHDATEQERWLWRVDGVGSDVPSPLIEAGKIFILKDSGVLCCVDAASGQTRWEERLPRSRRRYFSSPLLAGGVLYCVREDGAVVSASVDEGYRFLSETFLGDDSVATPTPIDGGLLFRTRTKLIRFQAN
ncbi:outer membrane biogenesis protein BamB [Posidoniimonas polymericola]|uniref:Outer membrane biogenesis protein BamB n=1 Tax=Posidoniimonas polymericola TaxID=2528002 RepID=A0A5C5ZEU8_9BACT|nr:PQQ-binding-like beta-propeller repeat protein [Posidoniimonas polymericola]TWT85685.1 outer membrane biogenesis protein BamB [Posidoniimonas polymericola]